MRASFVICCWLGVALLLTACGTPRAGKPGVVRDAYYHRMMTSGHSAFERGDLARAAELYENAWVRARIMDRPAAIGASAYNLAVCRIALDDLATGRALLQEARAELQQAGDSGLDALLAEAEAARLMGETDAAWALTEEVLTDMHKKRAPYLRVQVRALRALLALDREDVTTALAEAALAEDALRRDSAHQLRARVFEVRGRLASYAHEPLKAARAFDAEAQHYRDDARFADMARALMRAALAYRVIGDEAAALDRYYRAARHYAASEQTVAALRLMEEALQGLEPGEYPEEEQRWTRLFDEMSEPVKIKEE